MLETQLFTNYPRTQIGYWATVPVIVKNFQKAIAKDQITNHIISSIREVFSDYTPHLVWWFLMSIIRYTYGQIPSIEQPRDLDFIIDGKENILPYIKKLQASFPNSFLSKSSLWAHKRYPFWLKWEITVDIRSAQRKNPDVKSWDIDRLNDPRSTQYFYPNYQTRWLQRHKKIYKPDIYHHLSNEFSFSANLTALDLKKQTMVDLWWMQAIHEKTIIPITDNLSRIDIFYGLRLEMKTWYSIIPRFPYSHLFEYCVDPFIEQGKGNVKWVSFLHQTPPTIQKFKNDWAMKSRFWKWLTNHEKKLQRVCISYLMSKWIGKEDAQKIFQLTREMMEDAYTRWIKMCI